jgi:hypothetical protein
MVRGHPALVNNEEYPALVNNEQYPALVNNEEYPALLNGTRVSSPGIITRNIQPW